MNKSSIAKWISVWFGAGLTPWAQGTWGSIAALPLAWMVEKYFSHIGLLAFSWIIFFIGWWSCSIYVKDSGKQDPREAVIDEVAGQCLLLAVMPLSIKSYLIGLALFRFFDILKPWPVSVCDRRIHGGLGVMLDDMVAAAYPIVLVVIYCIVMKTDLFVIYSWLK